MPYVGNVYLVGDDRIEDEITQAWSNNDARIRLVRRPAFKRTVGKLPRPLNEPRNQTGGNLRTFLTDLVVNSDEITLCRTGEANLHAR